MDTARHDCRSQCHQSVRSWTAAALLRPRVRRIPPESATQVRARCHPPPSPPAAIHHHPNHLRSRPPARPRPPHSGSVWMQPWLKLPGLDLACRLPGCCLVGTLGCTCLARLPGAVAGCQAWEIERLGGQLTCLVLMTLVNTDGLSSLLTFPFSSPLPLSWCFFRIPSLPLSLSFSLGVSSKSLWGNQRLDSMEMKDPAG